MFTAAIVTTIVGCQSAPSLSEHARPAVISDASAETAKIVANAIGSILGQGSPTIADTAFSDTNSLSIHRTQLAGRDYETPEIFRLMTQNGACYLVHQNSKEQKSLENLDCRPLD